MGWNNDEICNIQDGKKVSSETTWRWREDCAGRGLPSHHGGTFWKCIDPCSLVLISSCLYLGRRKILCKSTNSILSKKRSQLTHERNYFPLTSFGNLGPKLLDILEHHVTMAIKSLDSGQKLFVVSAIDQDLDRKIIRISITNWSVLSSHHPQARDKAHPHSPACCSWRSAWGRRVGRCWTPVPPASPTPRASFPSWVSQPFCFLSRLTNQFGVTKTALIANYEKRWKCWKYTIQEDQEITWQ